MNEVAQERAAAWALSLGIVVVPLLQIVPLDFDHSALVAAFAPALVLGRKLWRRSWTELPRLLHWTLGALGVIVVIGVARAVNPAASAVMASTAFFAFLVGLLGMSLGRAHAGMFARAIAFSALATLAVFLYFSSLLPYPLQHDWGKKLPLFPHIRHFGIFLLPPAIVSWFLLAGAPPDSPRRGGWALAALAIWSALLWTGGRAPLLGLLVTCALCMWLERGRRRELLFTAISLFLGGLGVSLLFGVGDRSIGWWSAIIRTHNAGSTEVVLSGRTLIWTYCLEVWKDRPVLGWGLDGYRFLAVKQSGTQPHNFIVHTLLETGVAGTVLILAALGTALAKGARSSLGPHARWAWAVVVGSVVVAFFDGSFYHTLGVVPAAVALGVLAAELIPAKSRRSTDESAHSVSTDWIRRAVVAVATVVAAAHIAQFHSIANGPIPGDEQALRVRALRAFPSTTIALPTWIQHWDKSDPDVAYRWIQWGQEHASNAWLYHLEECYWLLRRQRHEEALVAMDRAIAKLSPENRPALQRQKDQLLRALRALQR